MKIFNYIRNLFGKTKIEPPEVFGIVKLTENAKENGIYDDQNKIIELNKYGEKTRIKYSEADVEALREQGIPIVEEGYSDNYEWTDLDVGGTIEYKK